MFGLNLGATSSSASGYDPDADAYFTAVEAASGTLSDTFKTNYNTMILTLKSDGVYSKLLRFNPNAGGTEAAAEVDQIIPTTNNINFVNSPTIDAEIGITFDGFTQYATTGFVPSTGFADAYDHQEGVFSISPSTVSNGNIIGAQDSNLILLKSRHTGGRIHYFAHYSISSTSFPAANQMIQGSRQNNSYMQLTIDGVIESSLTTTTSNPLPAVEFYYGAKNKNDVAEQFANGKWCFMYLAQSLTDADELNLSNAIHTFIASL